MNSSILLAPLLYEWIDFGKKMGVQNVFTKIFYRLTTKGGQETREMNRQNNRGGNTTVG
jgi:hypothetical protein